MTAELCATNLPYNRCTHHATQ